MRTATGRGALLMSRKAGRATQAASHASTSRMPNDICFGIIDWSATRDKLHRFCCICLVQAQNCFEIIILSETNRDVVTYAINDNILM